MLFGTINTEYLFVVTIRSLARDGWKTMETQKLRNCPGPGSVVVESQSRQKACGAKSP